MSWRVGPWLIEPWRVFGGFKVVWTRWVLEPEGWDQEHEPTRDRTIYRTEAEAREAIARLEGVP